MGIIISIFLVVGVVGSILCFGILSLLVRISKHKKPKVNKIKVCKDFELCYPDDVFDVLEKCKKCNKIL